MWWQVPVGNMSLPNTPNQWRDNCVDYLMSHLGEVAAKRARGVSVAPGLESREEIGACDVELFGARG